MRVRLVVAVVLILVLIIANLGGVWWILDAHETDGHAINEAGEQRMLTQKMTWEAHQVAMGHTDQHDELSASADEFDRTLDALLTGDSDMGIPEPPGEVTDRLIEVREAWESFSEHIDLVLEHPPDSEEAATGIAYIETHNTELLHLTDDAVTEYEAAFDAKIVRLKQFLIGIFLLDLVVIIGISTLANRNVIRPIKEIAGDAEAIALGELDRHIATTDFDDEIGHLSQSVNEMREQLVGSIKKHRQFKHAIDHAGHAIFITDAEGFISHINPAFEAITGYTATEVIGQSPSILSSDHHTAHYHEDLWDTISTESAWEEGVVYQRASGERFHAVQTIESITDDDGTIVAYVGIMADATEHIMRAQQNQVFARVLRHNLRTELTLIGGYADELATAEDHDDRRRAAEEIDSSITALIALSDKADTSLNLLSTDTAQLTEPVGDVLTSVTDRLTERHPSATIDVDHRHDLAHLPIIAECAIEELIENAIVHNPSPDAHVWVTVDTDDREGATVPMTVEIVDDGPGIEPAERAVIESGDESALFHSSGIGLWLAHWATMFAGGHIEIEPAGDAGTRVRLEFSASAEPAHEPADAFASVSFDQDDSSDSPS